MGEKCEIPASETFYTATSSVVVGDESVQRFRFPHWPGSWSLFNFALKISGFSVLVSVAVFCFSPF